MIELSNIEFTYPGQKIPTLKISSLKIEKKERVFIFGPSGSGKSTLLEILAGVLVPQKGQVRILASDLAKMTSGERDQFRAAHLGYVFQSFNLIPYLSVQENIELPVHLSPEKKLRLGAVSIADEVHRLASSLGISEYLERRVTELSVGQQQRVAVARALFGQPELILADEPTSSLDYDHRERFISLLFEQCEKQSTTLLFVSHDRSLEKLFSRKISFAEVNHK
jgi:putative ABC transport system ATP-binding protein